MAAEPALLACAPAESAKQQQHGKKAPKQQQRAGQRQETPASKGGLLSAVPTAATAGMRPGAWVPPSLHAAVGSCFPGTIGLWGGAAHRQLLPAVWTAGGAQEFVLWHQHTCAV